MFIYLSRSLSSNSTVYHRVIQFFRTGIGLFKKKFTETWSLELFITQTRFNSPLKFKPQKFYCRSIVNIDDCIILYTSDKKHHLVIEMTFYLIGIGSALTAVGCGTLGCGPKLISWAKSKWQTPGPFLMRYPSGGETCLLSIVTWTILAC